MQNLNKIFKSHLYNGKSNLLLSRELYLFKKSALGKSENESINNIIEGNTQFENTTEQQIIEDNLESKNNIKKNNKEFQIAKSRKLYLQKSNVKKKLYAIIDLMINRGINENSCLLGSYYVLCALTMVSSDAANTLPWLYEAVN